MHGPVNVVKIGGDVIRMENVREIWSVKADDANHLKKKNIYIYIIIYKYICVYLYKTIQ